MFSGMMILVDWFCASEITDSGMMIVGSELALSNVLMSSAVSFLLLPARTAAV